MSLHLSPREIEVCVLAGCVTAPMTAKGIAKELGISSKPTPFRGRTAFAKPTLDSTAHPAVSARPGSASPSTWCARSRPRSSAAKPPDPSVSLLASTDTE
jgi:hypothetical protein